MKKLLITGATGNVGKAVISSLANLEHQLLIYAGLRNIATDGKQLETFDVKLTHFDFTDPNTFEIALADVDILFLLRPPQISDVNTYFKPLISICTEKEVEHIVFLSVQGVENSKIIPHHKIEKLIVESGIPYTFLRPAYFMQNFTSTLRVDLLNKNEIFLPAGDAKFALVDVRDIGAVSAQVLTKTALHRNKSYELTSQEKLSFGEMAGVLSDNLKTEIRYKSPNLLSFFIRKRKEKTPIMLILVMIMLHYLPRFQKEPAITDWIEKLTGKPAISFEKFVKDEVSKPRKSHI